MSLANTGNSYSSIPLVSSVAQTLPQPNEPSATGIAKQEPGMVKSSTPAHIIPPVTNSTTNPINSVTKNNTTNGITNASNKGVKSPSHKTGVLDNVAVASQGFYDVDKALMR